MYRINLVLRCLLQMLAPGTRRTQLASYSLAVLAANTPRLAAVRSHGCIAKRVLGARVTEYHVHHSNRTRIRRLHASQTHT
ncbi:hypothetical protein EV401DRAFT_2000803 [Pisolithus croceorrhizus]|nr:hypothetical protein EV401DRAFT_2000803 [Pisolithus croceorrhizus]